MALLILSVAAYGGVTLYEDYTADTTGPKISMDSAEVTVSVEDGEEAILQGVTAEDARDGDVTAYLVVETMSNFITDGVRDATIVSFDESGNVTKTSRRVTYIDYTSPQITLSGPLAAPVNDTSELLDVIQVTDCLDGDLTEQVQIIFDNTNQSAEVGDCAMHIQVSNSAGDTLDLPVTVRFYDQTAENSAAKLTLTEYLIYLEMGSKFDPLDYLDTLTVGNRSYHWSTSDKQMVSDDEDSLSNDEEDVISRSAFDIEDGVDESTPGTYEVTYTYEGEDDVTGVTRLVVIVEEE
ncbi:MAG: bacterial Ig-like domain-containing protein [Lachnospiraceae bacterium]|nr:bacterial Ig-like domain-containing protein [Lachnospiraceae bacterium]